MGKMIRTLAPWLLASLIACPAAISAKVLEGLAEPLAAVEVSAFDATASLLRRHGIDNSTLSFSGQIGLTALHYDLAPNSMYNGLPLVMSVSGALVGPRNWQLTSTGSLGAQAWADTIVISFTPLDSAIVPLDDVPDSSLTHGSDGDWEWDRLTTWRVDPDDPFFFRSDGLTEFRHRPSGKSKFVSHTDFQRRVFDLEDLLSFNARESGEYADAGAAVLTAAGTFQAATGQGDFTIQVVPEPSALVLLGAGLAVTLLYARRRL
jgi:hypothetical protein